MKEDIFGAIIVVVGFILLFVIVEFGSKRITRWIIGKDRNNYKR